MTNYIKNTLNFDPTNSDDKEDFNMDLSDSENFNNSHSKKSFKRTNVSLSPCKLNTKKTSFISDPSVPIVNNVNPLQPQLTFSSQSPSQFKTSTLPAISEYPEDIPPPYKIIIKSSKINAETETLDKFLSPINIARKLIPLFPDNSFDEFKKSGKDKVIIVTHKRSIANTVLKHDFFNKHNLTAFIPTSYVYKKGILKGIPTDMTDEEILQNLELSSPVSKLKALSIYRFSRKVTDSEGKETYIPTGTIQFTFKGQVMPQYAMLYRVRYNVELYIPKIRFCTNCFRHGHSKQICKSKPRCIYCGNFNHLSDACSDLVKKNNPQCLNCSGNHLPFDKDCQTKKIEQHILTMATRKQKTIHEVRTELKEQSHKRFRFTDFPEHLASFSSQEIIDPSYSQHQFFNKPSFAKIVKPTPSDINSHLTPPSPKSKSTTPFSSEHKQLLISPNGNYNMSFHPLCPSTSSPPADFHPPSPASITDSSGLQFTHLENSLKINDLEITLQQFALIHLLLSNDPNYSNALETCNSSNNNSPLEQSQN